MNGIVRLIEDYFKVKDERDDKSPGGKDVNSIVQDCFVIRFYLVLLMQ